MKQLVFKDENGKEYTLEYSKTSIMHMERQGFNMDDFDSKPVLMTTLLIQGAFIKNHSNVKYDKIDKLFKSLKDKTAFLSKLVEMYNEQADELVAEGNVEWEANW